MLTHGDSVERIAENFKSIAHSSTTIVGIANEKANIFGVQFHPEVCKYTTGYLIPKFTRLSSKTGDIFTLMLDLLFLL